MFALEVDAAISRKSHMCCFEFGRHERQQRDMFDIGISCLVCCFQWMVQFARRMRRKKKTSPRHTMQRRLLLQ